jgi:LPS O-antigen subunit length determinant protein (WzzB/FepE family)
MAVITAQSNRQITIRNEIKVDEKIVVGQTATIDTNNPNNLDINSWKNDKELYKEFRTEIRELQAQFEDEVYSEQDKLIAEKGVNE